MYVPALPQSATRAVRQCADVEPPVRYDPRADRSFLLDTSRHRVKQLQQVVAGYEDKARRQEQIDR